MQPVRRNSYSGQLPQGNLPTLPARGAGGGTGLPPKPQNSGSNFANGRDADASFLPSLKAPSGTGLATGPMSSMSAALAGLSSTVDALNRASLERAGSKGRSQSVPRAVESGRIKQARPQLPLRRPERIPSDELKQSVAAKLQPLEQTANAIKQAIDERKPGGTPIVKATCKDFVVGRASCSSSSVVTLFPDRLEYKFRHTTQGEIAMCMYVKDMQGAEVDSKSLVMKFRVGKPLRHFIDSYDVTDPKHILSLTFYERGDASAFADALTASCKLQLQILGDGF